MLPPGVERKYEDNAPWIQAMILAYGQIRRIEKAKEEDEKLTLILKAIAHAPG